MANTTIDAASSAELGDGAQTRQTLERLLKASECLRETIDFDPDKRGGVPVLKGTRFKAAQLLAQLADGDSIGDLEENLELDRDVMEQFLRALSVILDRPWTTHPDEFRRAYRS